MAQDICAGVELLDGLVALDGETVDGRSVDKVFGCNGAGVGHKCSLLVG